MSELQGLSGCEEQLGCKAGVYQHDLMNIYSCQYTLIMHLRLVLVLKSRNRNLMSMCLGGIVKVFYSHC